MKHSPAKPTFFVRPALRSVPVPVVASGGVTTVEDIKNLVSIEAAGAIVGKALYEGTLTLANAIETAK